MGEKLDKAHGDRMEPGGFVFLPGMMPHSVWTAGTETVVQVTGTGPFGLIYVNPEDDPSKARWASRPGWPPAERICRAPWDYPGAGLEEGLSIPSLAAVVEQRDAELAGLVGQVDPGWLAR